MGCLRWLILAAAAGAPLSAQIEWVYPANLGPHPPTKWIAKRTCYGEGTASAEIRQSHSIEYFSKSYPETDKCFRILSEGQNLSTKLHEVGRQDARRVVDLFYFRADKARPMAKLLLLEADSGFKPLVFIITSGGTEVDMAPTTIVDYRGTQIISNSCQISGSGHYMIEDFFVFDESRGFPVRLPVDRAIGEQLRRILPSGMTVRRGGGFDIKTMTFQHSVWNENDSNAGPTGGAVRIEFALRHFELQTVFAGYDPLGTPQ